MKPLLNRLLLAAFLTIVCSCQFTFERALEPGEIRGVLQVSLADESREAAADASVRVEGSNLAVRTDRNGRFVLRHMPEGTYRLRMRHERNVGSETVVSALTVNAELTQGGAVDLGHLSIKALGALSGVVRRGGEPDTATLAIDGEAVALSDFAAGYTMSKLEAGRRVLAVRAMGPNGPQLYEGPTVDIQPRRVTVADVSLEALVIVPPSSISVRVRLSDGGDSSGIDVELHDGESMVRTLSTGADGVASDVELPAGIYTVVAKKQGYLPSRLAAVVVNGEVRTPQMILTPDACRPASQEAGCEDIAAGDADADGIPDYLDHCPDDALDACAPGVTPVPDAPRFCGSGLQDRDGDGVCKADCTTVSCETGRSCDDATGRATCVCVPGHVGDDCVPEQTPTVAFIASASSAVAGVALSSVSVEILDHSGKRATGAQGPVTLALGSANGATLGGTTTATPQAGVATFSNLVVEKAGAGYTLVATAPGVAGATSTPFNIAPAAFDAGQSGLSTSGDGAVANGASSVSLTVRAADGFGNAIAGQSVLLSSIDGNDFIAPGTGETDGAGEFVAALASTKAGTRTITAHVGGRVFTAAVTFVAGEPANQYSTLHFTQASATANGLDSIVFTFTARDANENAIAGQDVRFTSSSSAETLAPERGTTNSFGVVTATLKSTKAEAKTITAQAGPSSIGLKVTFVAGAVDAEKSSAQASPARAPADGASASVVSVVARDAFENAVPNASVSLSAGTTNATITQPAATDASGTTSGSIVSSEPETMTVSVTVNGLLLTDAPEVTFTAPFTIGGTVTGLSGAGLVLANNGSDLLPVSADGAFTFDEKLYEGSDYAVTVATPPANQACTVLKRRGSVGTSKVDDIEVKCGSAWAQVFSGAGGEHTLGIKADGSLWAWGLNDYGQLGDGSTTNSRVPLPIMPGRRFVAAAAGAIDSVAIEDDGALWAWGYNASGEESFTPVRIMQGTSFVAVSAGPLYRLAIDAGGALWAWGYNAYGVLGDGTETSRPLPGPTMSTKTFIAMGTGGNHSFAIDVGGSLWGWSGNWSGQVGDGSSETTVWEPVVVNAGTKFTGVGGGESHSAAVDEAGGLWAWGVIGIWLPDGGQVESLVPLRLLPGVTVTSLAVGAFHNLALDEDGRLWAWGTNQGQCRQLCGSLNYGGSPVPASSSEVKFASVAAGKAHSLAVDENGSLWAWGDNRNGQLGFGGASNLEVEPVFVP